MVKWIKEWNITYSIHDGEGRLDEFFVVLPSFLKVLWWFVRSGRKACHICIWKSARGIDQKFEWEDWNAED